MKKLLDIQSTCAGFTFVPATGSFRDAEFESSPAGVNRTTNINPVFHVKGFKIGIKSKLEKSIP